LEEKREITNFKVKGAHKRKENGTANVDEPRI